MPQNHIASFQVGEETYYLVNGSSSASTGTTHIEVIEGKTQSRIPFFIASESDKIFILGDNKSDLRNRVVFLEDGSFTLSVSIDKGTFPVQIDVQSYPFQNVHTYDVNQSELALIIDRPRYPGYGIAPITFLVVENAGDFWKISDNWNVSFVPWMNMGKSGHGSQFNVQPSKLDSAGLTWQMGKVSFSMDGEWDLRVSLSNPTTSESIKDTLVLDVLDEEELEAILHAIPVLGRGL